MADRMYWLDHRVPEDTPDPTSAMSKSCSNIFEVDMVVGLVQYLISGNAYDLGDISVLVSHVTLRKLRVNLTNVRRPLTTGNWQL